MSFFYYYYHNDNVELLNDILDNNIHLNVSDLVLLYKKLTDKIDRKTYLYLLKNEKVAVENFIYSIKLDSDNINGNEIAISRFADIVNNNPDVFYESDKSIYQPFITKESLKWFNNETLINTTDEQKSMIKSIYDSYCYQDNDRIKATFASLVVNNSFSKILYHIEDYIDTFTIDEILKMTDEQIEIINQAFLWEDARGKKETNKVKKKKKKVLNK